MASRVKFQTPRKKTASPSGVWNIHSTPWWVAGLALAFLFRTLFGLFSEIWFIDQHQIYLIGLKFYATGQWPFFGPDVASQVQLPGALQGLVVGLPLFLCPIPEAPYLLLNLLSFGGLCLLGWTFSKRLPRFPRWMIFAWLLTAPWTLQWSTNIDNDSYMLFGSALFFTGFLESSPTFSLGLFSKRLANFLMGFGLFWCVQFHLSFVLLFPFAAYSLTTQWAGDKKGRVLSTFSFLGGSLVTGIFLLPTFLTFGLSQGTGGTEHTVAFNLDNLLSPHLILARFLSLASCEIPRFMGAHSADRLEFLRDHPFLAPFALVALILGIAQAIALFVLGFRKSTGDKNWPKVRNLALATYFLIYASFLFAIKAPASHTFFLTLPVVMLYGFYAFQPFASNKTFLTLAKILLVCNLVFHAGLGVRNFGEKSLYKDRQTFVRAIAEKNYHLLGERRDGARY